MLMRGRVGGHHREQASLATQRPGVDTIDRTYLDTHHRFSPLAKMDGAELTLRGGRGAERSCMGVMVDIGVVGNEAATAGEPANLWRAATAFESHPPQRRQSGYE